MIHLQYTEKSYQVFCCFFFPFIEPTFFTLSCHTDISMATVSGMQSLLVLTGVSTLSDVETYKASGDPTQATYVPTYYANKLGQLGKLLGFNIP